MIEVGSITFTSTGNQSIYLNNITGTPTWVIFFTGGKYGVNETTNARGGFGASDIGNYQFASANLKNGSGSFTRTYPGTDSFVLLDGASGNPAVRGDVTGAAPGQIDVNLTNVDANFQVFVICGDN